MSVDWTGTAAAIATALRGFGVESDLSDATLAAKAKSAIGEIAKRTGIGTSVDLVADGTGHRFIPLDPPAASVSGVTEDGVTVAADPDGYRLRPGGILLERLSGGSPSRWRGDIHVTYAAAATDDRYDRVVTDLVKLSLEWSGLDARRDGDYSEEAVGEYQVARDGLIDELASAGGWVL